MEYNACKLSTFDRERTNEREQFEQDRENVYLPGDGLYITRVLIEAKSISQQTSTIPSFLRT